MSQSETRDSAGVGEPSRAPGRAVEIALWILVLGAAAVWRLWDLDLKPLHSDEAMNGFFMRRLFEEHVYRYQPSDFHGPLLYFGSFLPMKLFGASDFTLRFATAAAGVAAVASLGLYRRWMGAWGALAAAALLAASAPDVYYARTCIHETWLVLSSLLAGAFTLRALEGGHRRHFALAALSWACAAAAKETVVLTGAAFGAALLAALLPGLREPLRPPFIQTTGSPSLRSWVSEHRQDLLLALVTASLLLVLLFTSFFSYPRGLVALFEAWGPWVEYGVTGRNQSRPPGYFTGLWGWWAPVLMVAVWGLALGLSRRSRFALFALVWFGASLLIYELLPYKTPWCALEIGLPLFLLAGFGIGALCEGRSRARRVLGAALALATLGVALAEGWRASYDANFIRYDDPRIPFVYVQTRAGFMDLVDDLNVFRENRKRVEGPEAESRLVSVEPKNALRWYLYSGGWPDAWTTFLTRWAREDEPQRMKRLRTSFREAAVAMVPLVWEENARELIGAEDLARRTYPGRPGTTYVLLVRRNLERYLPRPGRPRIDGGGDPLVERDPPPPSFLPFVANLENVSPKTRSRP